MGSEMCIRDRVLAQRRPMTGLGAGADRSPMSAMTMLRPMRSGFQAALASATAYCQRRNGNLPRELARPLHFPGGQLFCRTKLIATAVAVPGTLGRLLRLGLSRPMPLDFMTCWAMSGSGLRTVLPTHMLPGSQGMAAPFCQKNALPASTVVAHGIQPLLGCARLIGFLVTQKTE